MFTQRKEGRTRLKGMCIFVRTPLLYRFFRTNLAQTVDVSLNSKAISFIVPDRSFAISHIAATHTSLLREYQCTAHRYHPQATMRAGGRFASLSFAACSRHGQFKPHFICCQVSNTPLSKHWHPQPAEKHGCATVRRPKEASVTRRRNGLCTRPPSPLHRVNPFLPMSTEQLEKVWSRKLSSLRLSSVTRTDEQSREERKKAC